MKIALNKENNRFTGKCTPNRHMITYADVEYTIDSINDVSNYLLRHLSSYVTNINEQWYASSEINHSNIITKYGNETRIISSGIDKTRVRERLPIIPFINTTSLFAGQMYFSLTLNENMENNITDVEIIVD